MATDWLGDVEKAGSNFTGHRRGAGEVNRMLKDHDHRITPQGGQDVDEFLSWLRKIGHDYRERICLILSGR